MYRPAYARLDEPALLHRLIAERPFATLARVREGRVLCAAGPLYLREGALVGHLARANPFTQDLDGAELCAVFSGPDGYVSPTWYQRPQEQVPTWNYVQVEARGPACLMDGVELLEHMVALHEPEWRVEPGLRDQLLRAIVAFAITPLSLEGKVKLSQNRDPQDRQRVEDRFAELNPELARWMREAATSAPGSSAPRRR